MQGHCRLTAGKLGKRLNCYNPRELTVERSIITMKWLLLFCLFFFFSTKWCAMVNRNLVSTRGELNRGVILSIVNKHESSNARDFCYAKTSSSEVQKRQSKVYGNHIAPSFYSILLVSTYIKIFRSYMIG